jgi:hypothetical protein
LGLLQEPPVWLEPVAVQPEQSVLEPVAEPEPVEQQVVAEPEPVAEPELVPADQRQRKDLPFQ